MFGTPTPAALNSAHANTQPIAKRDDTEGRTSHVVVDTRLRVISHDTAVKSLLKHGAELTIASGSLSASDPVWQREILGLAISALAQSKTQCSTSPQGTLRVEFRGLCGATPHTAHATQLLVVVKPNLCAINTAQVARVYGLTPTETDILDALCSGIRAWAYAQRKDVSIHTVRKQVKNIRAKLGVQSQLEAVRLVDHTRYEAAS